MAKNKICHYKCAFLKVKFASPPCHIQLFYVSVACMKRFAILFIASLIINICFGQSEQNENKLSPKQLRTDLTLLQHLITEVHVNPYWEISADEYKALFAQIGFKLTDSLSATNFLKLIKPVIAHLSDEHSQLYLKQTLQSPIFRNNSIFPPFTLSKVGEHYFIDDILEESGQLKKRDEIIALNGVSIATLVKQCALDTIGFPHQRIIIALKRFGYLYPWSTDKETPRFRIQTSDGKIKIINGIQLKAWEAYMKVHNVGMGSNCEERITYRKYADVGYIQAYSFDVKPTGSYSLDSIKAKINHIFQQIQTDGVQKLIIDVSKNSGGNSAVGDYLISSFYAKPYRGYHIDFKKSAEYLKLYESWGFSKPAWASVVNGEVLHYAADTIMPENVPHRFNGKVTIVMGPPTFSSAMTFVTLIRDNHIALVIGQPSLNGHPTELGEQFYTTLPNSKIFVRLSVKEFIRPADKIKDNVLIPNKLLTDDQLSNPMELIKIINE